MKENKSSQYGLNFAEALQIAFIVLKLCKVINWSWWWVLSPTWVCILLVIILYIIIWFAD